MDILLGNSATYYHGTIRQAPVPIREFHALSHFGTRQAALDTIARRWHRDGLRGIAEIYAVTIRVSRLLAVAEFHSNDAEVLLDAYKQAAHCEPRDYAAAKRELHAIAKRHARSGPDEITRLTRDALAKRIAERFDAVVHESRFEDPGCPSLCLVRPELAQIEDRRDVDLSDIAVAWSKTRHLHDTKHVA